MTELNGSGSAFARVIYVIERIGIAGALLGYILYQLPHLLEVVSHNTLIVEMSTKVQEQQTRALEKLNDRIEKQDQDLREHRTLTERYPLRRSDETRNPND